jgi:quercetin dioxygenase-like cupin family protein
MLYHRDQDQTYELNGNHMSGVATPSRGAASVEVWRGTMDAGAATPPHQHEHEEVVLVLAGHGRAVVDGREVRYQAGDTVILPPGKVHQIFADSATELVAAMPLASPICTPDGAPLDLPWRR